MSHQLNEKGLLAGIKVVELATFVAGPSAGRMLSHFGAEVIKIETLAGEYFRTFGAKYDMPVSYTHLYTDTTMKVSGGYTNGIARYITAKEGWDTLREAEKMGVQIRDTKG